jgi:hypothetical protein
VRERERERGSLQQHQSALQELPLTVGWDPAVPAWDVALPAWEARPKGGKGTKGTGDQPEAPQPFIPNQLFIPAQPVATPKPKARNDVPYTDEQRAANGVCWFFNRGSCAKKNCQRTRKILTVEERKQVPESFWNPPDKSASSGQESDSAANERTPKGRGRGAVGRGRGPKILGCRYINNREECPHGDRCNFVWAHGKPPMGPAGEWDRRPRNRGPAAPGPTIVEETSDQGASAGAASSSASEASGPPRGSKPSMPE